MIARVLRSLGSVSACCFVLVGSAWVGSQEPAPGHSTSASAAEGSSQFTNVLLIVADDLGYMDVGFNNPQSFYETPHLDALAASAMRFTDGYAACPVCSPTRASLLSGQHPARMNTTDWFGAPQPEGVLRAIERDKGLNRFRQAPLLPASYVNHLPLETTTLAEALKEEGYATFFAGKWHLGGEGFEPTTQGFDENIAGNHRGGPYGRGRYFHPFDMPNLESEEGDHLPARLAEETVRFLTETKDGPSFAMLSFYSVHTPLVGRPDLVEYYRAKKERLGLENTWIQEGERKVRQVQEHAVYAAMVHAMDEAVGEVLAALDTLEIADSTLVIFTSDNGGLSTSEGHPTSNLPYRAGKGWLYEGGIREPWLVRWPGQTEPGATCEVPITSTDVFPSVLEVAGLKARPGAHRDGHSFAGLLRGESSSSRKASFWHYPHYGNQGGSPGGAVRVGDWKLIEFFGEAGATELYNLSADPGETRNLADQDPEQVQVLEELLVAWRAEVDARMPEPNPAATK